MAAAAVEADAFKQSSGMAKNEVKEEPTYATVVKPPAGAAKAEKSKEMTRGAEDIHQKQMMPWPARERPQKPAMFMMQQQSPKHHHHHPNCNTQLVVRQSAPLFQPQQQQMIMTQSYPGPCILQPQKVATGTAGIITAQPAENQNNKPMDKEFIAELEKNLGLVEANANLMPPSSPSVTVQQPQLPTLLPPPHAATRNSNRRSHQYSYSPAPAPVQVPQNSSKRETSLPRQMANEGPLRVALPDETKAQPAKNTAHVKPFLSPNAKQQQGRMGDVAAARDNWKPLSVGNGGSASASNSGNRDFLSDQKRQLAEIERLRAIQSGISRNSRSQSVAPPNGAARPTNHLEVNKMAQVSI